MTDLKDYQHKVYLIGNDSKVEAMVYKDYLNQYHSDEVTSPRGVENRKQVCAVLFNEDGEIVDYSLNNREALAGEEGNYLKWAVWDWGPVGNRGHIIKHNYYETEEEAYLVILKGKEDSYERGSYNYPFAYDSLEDANEALVELKASEWGVDLSVAKHLIKKEDWLVVARAQQAFLKKKQEKEDLIKRVSLLPPNDAFEAKWMSKDLKEESGLSWVAYRNHLKATYPAEWQIMKLRFKAKQA